MAVPVRRIKKSRELDNSGEVFDPYCKQCYGINRQASEYCTHCNQELCAVCTQWHHSPYYHDSMYNVAVSSDTDSTAFKPLIDDNICELRDIDDDIFEKHATKKKDDYCSLHGNSDHCNVCTTLDHGTCSDFDQFGNTCYRNKYRRDVTKLHKKVDTLEKDSKLFHSKLLEDIKCVKEAYDIVLKQIIAYREKMIEQLDKLYTNTVKEAQSIKKQNREIVNDLIADTEDLQVEIEEVRVQVEEMSSKDAVFIRVKKAEKKMNSAEMKLNQLQEARDSLSLGRKFVGSSDFEYLLSNHKTLGSIETTVRLVGFHESVAPGSAAARASASSSSKLEINQQSDDQENEKIEQLFVQYKSHIPVENKLHSFKKYECFDSKGSNDFEFSDKNILYSGLINLKTAKDRYPCGINDCLILEPGRLVVTDGFNSCVKLVDVDMSTVQSACYLVHSPDCVTAVSECQLAVTLPMTQSIMFLDVGVNVKVSHQVQVQGECRGIAYKDGKLAVTFKKPNRVMIMKTDGSVLHTVISPYVNANLNITPSAIIFGTERDTLIMSDIFNHVVVKVDFSGKKLVSYDSDTLCLPLGLTMTEEGNILVCCSKSACVHSISNDLKTGKVILQNEDSVTKPACVAFCSVTNKLYICNFGPNCSETVNNSVQVFQLL